MIFISVTGADSLRGDGVYTGVFNAAQFDGDGYYSWKVM